MFQKNFIIASKKKKKKNHNNKLTLQKNSKLENYHKFD